MLKPKFLSLAGALMLVICMMVYLGVFYAGFRKKFPDELTPFLDGHNIDFADVIPKIKARAK
jgi:hypothetical protein